MIYIVAYDLKEPNTPGDYARIIEAIKGYGNWMRVEQSVWTIESYDSNIQIRDNLMQYVRQQDALLVGRLTNAAWTGGLSAERINWLQTKTSW
jgi:hypothetical protein